MSDAALADGLLGGRVRLAQPAKGYRVAIDPVLLAAAVPAQAGERVLDVGCGTGAAALCLLARMPDVTVDGLEREAAFIALAEGNAEANGARGKFRVISGDVAAPPKGLALGSYDHVMTNPPYLPATHGHPPADPLACAAERESTADLATWAAFCAGAAKPGGSVTFIHRTDRADELCAALAAVGCGDLARFPLWPVRQGEGAKRVIVRAVKGAAPAQRIADGLVLHREEGGYTAAAEAVLRDARALNL